MSCILGHRSTACPPSYCSRFLLAPAGATVGMPNHTIPKSNFRASKTPFRIIRGGVNCILGHRVLSFLLLMLLACTRRRHSRHAKPYPKVILERRKHLFGSFNCILGHRLLSFLLLMHPQAPQPARQTIPKSNFGASKTPFRIIRGVWNAFLGTEVLLAQNDTQNDTETTPLVLAWCCCASSCS